MSQGNKALTQVKYFYNVLHELSLSNISKTNGGYGVGIKPWMVAHSKDAIWCDTAKLESLRLCL